MCTYLPKGIGEDSHVSCTIAMNERIQSIFVAIRLSFRDCKYHRLAGTERCEALRLATADCCVDQLKWLHAA